MSTVHVVPVADIVEHMTTEDCLCGPTPELVRTDQGGDGWLYVHHSLDGRENNE